MKTKQQLEDRWGSILNGQHELLPVLLNNYKKYSNEGAISSLISSYSLIGPLEYLVNSDVKRCQEALQASVSYVIELFDRFEKGEPIHPAHCSMINFIHLLDALASGDMELPNKLALHMGRREALEMTYDDLFVESLGYCLKYAVLGDIEELRVWLHLLREACEHPKYKLRDFLGYPLILEGLAENNSEKINRGFEVLLLGHKNRCKREQAPDYGPFFHNSPNAEIFFWGVGLANLCLSKKFTLKIQDDFIPKDLLLQTES